MVQREVVNPWSSAQWKRVWPLQYKTKNKQKKITKKKRMENCGNVVMPQFGSCSIMFSFRPRGAVSSTPPILFFCESRSCVSKTNCVLTIRCAYNFETQFGSFAIVFQENIYKIYGILDFHFVMILASFLKKWVSLWYAN